MSKQGDNICVFIRSKYFIMSNLVVQDCLHVQIRGMEEFIGIENTVLFVDAFVEQLEQ